MIDLATIKRLEELVLNSSAPRTQLLQGGWLVRLSRDDVKRARSVTALGDGGGELDARISHCEELYARQGLPPLFRLTPVSQPPGLDEALAVRGYTILEPTSVQTTPIGPELPQAEGKWEVVALDLQRWAEDVARLRGSTAAERERHLERMRNHGLPTHQVAVYAEDEIVGSGLVVIDGCYAGVLDMRTREDYRGRGIGRSILSTLLDFAREAGATTACLSVVEANRPALSLYGKFGFQTAYRYSYRQAPDQGGRDATAGLVATQVDPAGGGGVGGQVGAAIRDVAGIVRGIVGRRRPLQTR